ncbi:MAG: hypothetical protein P4M09_04735 [Devosia sp.]|nr:hypothetical protein [Devosia sp.]
MSVWGKWPIVAALVVLVTIAPAMARADEGEDDHEVARELYERGTIKPLEDILGRLKQQTAGDVVAIDLVGVGDRWVYRFQVIAPDGHRSIVDLDAGPMVASGRGGDD